MTLKTTVLLIVLALASTSIAAAASYHFSIGAPMNAGNVKLEPGDYSVAVQGSVAKITGPHYKSFTLPVKTETGTEKFKTTAVEATDKNGQQQLSFVEIGGSTTKLVFNN